MAINIISSQKSKAIITPDIQKQLDQLEEFKNNHSFWNNKLFQACEKGTLTYTHWQYIFGQYYLYNRNFTRYLAAVMANCDNDYYRAELSENLWEEAGNMDELDSHKGEDNEARHAELFRKFLTNVLDIDIDNIDFQDFSKRFAEQYLYLCIENDAMYGSSFLSYGTEGIVADLYTKLVEGMEKSGLDRKDLLFFTIHMECDDEHALTLAEMTAAYANEPHWFATCKKAIDDALTLREKFFNNLYETLWLAPVSNKIADSLLGRTSIFNPQNASDYVVANGAGEQLYKNENVVKNISFDVNRINIPSQVLDPRINIIEAGKSTENHNHGHETVIYILEGQGTFTIDGNSYDFGVGDTVFVPRWAQHQTLNTGSTDLKFLAVTDYKLATCFLGNFESTYRENKESAENIDADKKIKQIA